MQKKRWMKTVTVTYSWNKKNVQDLYTKYFLILPKSFQLRGALPPEPPSQGLCPWTPLRATPSDSHNRLALRARHNTEPLCGSAVAITKLNLFWAPPSLNSWLRHWPLHLNISLDHLLCDNNSVSIIKAFQCNAFEAVVVHIKLTGNLSTSNLRPNKTALC